MKYLIFIIIFLSFVSAGCSENQININFASESKLDEIVWIGPATAEKIINERPFEDLEDIDRVSGIGEKKLEDIIQEDLACVDDDEIEDFIDKEPIDNFEEILEEEFEEILFSEEELVYESKISKINNNLGYYFAVFILVIILGFVWQRF